MSTQDVSQPRTFNEVVASWQEQLLQLDKGNASLYFGSRTRGIRIVDLHPDTLVETLFSSRGGLKFDYIEPRSPRRSRESFEIQQDEELGEPEPYIIRGDLKVDCPPLDLQKRLGNLRRRAREWQQEQGLNVLFLALGFLEWIDEDGESAKAPLLLLPCQLDRASPRDPFVLTQDDDDLTDNYSLSVKLKQLGIELPEVDADLEQPSIFLDSVARAVVNKPGWKVDTDIYLSIFSYSKQSMVRDLDTIKEHGSENPTVLSLAGSPVDKDVIERLASARPTEIPQDLSGGRLDDLLPVKDQFAVLPADYSQLVAINQARSGANLVIHGPPGTGKSQTIANIIATFLAEGKSVLFVSEKTAALDVVKRRLDENQLGIFCLDMHSERGSKISVYRQLRESVEDDRTVRRLDFNYDSLSERRNALNRLTRALHQIRQPLGRTAFQVQSRFASFVDTPHVGFEVSEIENIDQARLIEILSLGERLSLREREFQEHWTSSWRILKSGAPSLGLANVIREDMNLVREAINCLQASAIGLSENLGVIEPRTLQELGSLGDLAKHLEHAPGIPTVWLANGVVAKLRRTARRESDRQRERNQVLSQLDAPFGAQVPALGFRQLIQDLNVDLGEQHLLEQLFGSEWSAALAQDASSIHSKTRILKSTIDQLGELSEESARFLRLPFSQETYTLNDAARLAEAATSIGSLGPVPEEWTTTIGNERVTSVLENSARVANDLVSSELRLFTLFESGILSVIDRDVLTRFRTDYQSRLRRLVNSRYRSDKKAIRSFSKTARKMRFEDELEAVQQAVDVLDRRENWSMVKPELDLALGERSRGLETDWNVVADQLKKTLVLMEGWKGEFSEVRLLITSDDDARQCHRFGEQLNNLTGQVEESLSSGISQSLTKRLREGELSLNSVGTVLNQAVPIVDRLRDAIDSVAPTIHCKIENLESLRDWMVLGARLREVETEGDRLSGDLRADFAMRFCGFDTDWESVESALSWAEQLLSIVPDRHLSDRLLEHSSNPNSGSAYHEIGEAIAEILLEYTSEVDSLNERYNLDEGPWQSWLGASFERVLVWTDDLSGDADSASDWIQYRTAWQGLDTVLRAPAVDMMRQATSASSDIPNILERRLMGCWLDWVYSSEPSLAQFSAPEHEGLRSAFSDLDRMLPLAARTEVRKRVFEGYPSQYASQTNTNDFGILRGQLSRRRRQLPVRRLFRTVPHLVQALKPCFMMSPLAVSQYLPLSNLASETLTFDVVIFDEASQILPEDAVPAILRADQVILAGDQKQLPPTTFWRRSASVNQINDSDDSDDIDPNQLEGMDSILDAAVGKLGQLFTEANLNIHYRSRDESLIRFSNHYFYGDRLQTFPGPGINDPWLGVHDTYLPEGRYYAGRERRINPKEAERAVDMVFEHMRTRPASESIGVVAMSRPQADFIEDLITQRRLQERDVEERFDENAEEPFFVKNLENVQGDERDHIIISIGYGPTEESGAVPNRFGPINQPGGERRLNVAVSRARQRVDLIHSLAPGHISSQQTGARLLRRYLEYAANPAQAFEARTTVNADAVPESPFEAAVGHALIEKGYRVERQIGVAGYRIDLGVMSEDEDKFDLGIECDGYTYHGTPAARDRDWLRQQVLEGLGWSIHRVWSTAWIRNPAAELAKIERAIETSRAGRPNTVELPNTVQYSDEDTEQEEDHSSEFVTQISSARSEQFLLEPYANASLDGFHVGQSLQFETTDILIGLVLQVASIEGPVHQDVVIERIRQRYNLGRVRGGTREKVEYTIQEALRLGKTYGSENFIWFAPEQLQRAPRMPADGNIEHIHLNELRAIVLGKVKELFGIDRQSLSVEIARALGFTRTGRRITQVIDSTVYDLLEEGRLVESFGSVRVNQDLLSP